jgi:type IV secretion system protein VirB6
MAQITAADFTLYNDLFSKLDTVADTYVTGAAADVIASITPVATSCGVLVIMIYGILLLRGSIEAPLMDAAFRALKLIVVVGLALNIGIYQSYIGDFFANAPSAMASVLTGTAGTGAAHSDAITDFTVAAYNLGDKMWQQGSALSFNFGPLLLAAIIWAFTAALGAYAVFLFALGKIATAVLLAIGPIFILLSVFESGKRFVEMWLQQLFNFGLIVVLTAACLNFFLATITTTTTESLAAATVPTSEVLYFVAFALIDVLVLRQVMPIASGLAGGMALATQGAFGAAAGAMGRAMGATAKRYTPNNIAERYRRNQRNTATWRKIRGEWGNRAASVKGAAQQVSSAASNAYKRKFEPNRVSKAA